MKRMMAISGLVFLFFVGSVATPLLGIVSATAIGRLGEECDLSEDEGGGGGVEKR